MFIYFSERLFILHRCAGSLQKEKASIVEEEACKDCLPSV